LSDLTLGRLNRRGRRGGGGNHLGQACPPVGRVEHNQRIAGVHTLVVGHLDGGHVALDARAKNSDVTLDIGIVGAFDIAALGEPPGGTDADGDNRRQRRGRAPKPAQAAAEAWRGGAGLAVVGQSQGLLGYSVHSGLL
jgi:hypothetical protein